MKDGAIYKFLIPAGEAIELPVPEQPTDKFTWEGVMCCVYASSVEEARAVAIKESPYDAPWLAVVTPQRIELDSPKQIALARM